MKENNEELILLTLQNLEKKVDTLSLSTCLKDRLDSETIAIITAATYNLFGKRVAVRSVKLVR